MKAPIKLLMKIYIYLHKWHRKMLVCAIVYYQQVSFKQVTVSLIIQFRQLCELLLYNHVRSSAQKARQLRLAPEVKPSEG